MDEYYYPPGATEPILRHVEESAAEPQAEPASAEEPEQVEVFESPVVEQAEDSHDES